ncbi:MAG TPA: PD-(D/E)XK nuclease family protein, partial [Solirubrobacteraceae bacterium]
AVDFERWPVSRQAPTAISWLGPALAADLPALAQAGESAVHDLPIAGATGTVNVRLRLSTPATVGTVLRPESFVHSPGEPLVSEPSVSGELALAGTQMSSERPIASEPDAEEPVPGELAPGEQLSFLVGDAPSIPVAPAYASVPASDSAPASPPVPASSTAPTPASVVTAAPASAGEPALTSLSYTSLSELERCGYRYYLERVLGFSEDRRAVRSEAGQGGLEARARGTLIHRLMESIDFSRPSPPSSQQVGALARELGLRTSANERDEIVALLDTAMRAHPALRVAGARAVRREHPFAFSLSPGEPLISGVIDLLAQESDGGAVVLDYKSDRVALTVDLEPLVARDYGVQRLLYALAVLRDGAPRVDVIHWFLERPGEAVVASFQAGERDALQRRLIEHVASARRRGFAVSANPHRGLCLTCPGRGSLCSWSEQETMKN